MYRFLTNAFARRLNYREIFRIDMRDLFRMGVIGENSRIRNKAIKAS